MLYMVELHYHADRRADLWQYFQARGFSHYEPGISMAGGWVSPEDCMAYALMDCKDGAALTRECKKLESFGTIVYRPVIAAEQL